MARPWKRIAIDFVVAITALAAARSLRRQLDRNGDGIRLRPGWLLAGIASSVGWGYAYDADVGGIRRRRGRRVVSTVCWSLLASRLIPDDDSTTYSIAVGTGFGTGLYRLWFGIVRPSRPGSNEADEYPRSRRPGPVPFDRVGDGVIRNGSRCVRVP